MAENNEPPAAPESPANRPLVGLPRRNVSADKAAAPPNASQLNDRLSLLADSMRDLAIHVGAVEPEDDAEFAKDRTGRRLKRFQRRGTNEELPAGSGGSDEEPTPPPPTGTEAELPPAVSVESEKRDAAALNRNVAWPRAGGAEAGERLVVAPSQSTRKRPSKKLLAVVVYGA